MVAVAAGEGEGLLPEVPASPINAASGVKMASVPYAFPETLLVHKERIKGTGRMFFKRQILRYA